MSGDDVGVLVIGWRMAGPTAAVRASGGGLYYRAYAGGIAPAVVFGLAAAVGPRQSVPRLSRSHGHVHFAPDYRLFDAVETGR